MFKIHKIYNKRAMAFCTKHKSQKGSADLDVTLEGEYAGKFYCYGCGYSGKISDEELESIRRQRGEIKEIEEIKDWNKFQIRCWANRISASPEPPLKVSREVLTQLQWGWYQGSHTFPERDAEDRIIGILRRWPDRNKGVVTGSKRGLYLPRINFDSKKTLYITEGVSDLACILECGLQGIGRPVALTCPSADDMIVRWLCLHSNEPRLISVIGDNDEAGQKGAKALVEKLNAVPMETGEQAFYVTWTTFSADWNDIYDMFLELGKEKCSQWLYE